MDMAGIAYQIMVCFVAALLHVPGADTTSQANVIAVPVRREAETPVSEYKTITPGAKQKNTRGTASLLLGGVFVMHLVCGCGRGPIARRRNKFRPGTLLLCKERLRPV